MVFIYILKHKEVLLRERKRHTAGPAQPSWFCVVEGGSTPVLDWGTPWPGQGSPLARTAGTSSVRSSTGILTGQAAGQPPTPTPWAGPGAGLGGTPPSQIGPGNRDQ